MKIPTMDSKSSNEELPKTEDQNEFKKPILFGRIGKLPKKAKSDDTKSYNESPPTNSKQENDQTSNSQSKSVRDSLPPAVLLKELDTPIPYKEPTWSGLCPDGLDYYIEILKLGTIMDKIDLTSKPYYVFGRLANCEIILRHPTISRHHCVVQYKAFANEGEPPCGWYLYDLGSTHGTFLNKSRLKPNRYTRVRVGHQIKFGTSSRSYIFMGPDFDCEGESELTVTEIKKKSLELKLEKQRFQEEKEKRERELLEEDRLMEEQGINWGMDEDAEDEPDLSDNPFAATANEELYLDDPKKTLRGYFEREGHELNYDCEERGVGQFICRVELPIDDARGRPVIAEVIHRGKKKEAVVACALEACRILDRAGVLRQARHESRKKKQRDWSADDYYDSDDDTYLDRTGSVEKKREQRMRKLTTAEQREIDKALTYDDLLKQISDIETKIANEERTLEELRSNSKLESKSDDKDADALDEFMSTLGKQGQSMAVKTEISKTKMSIQNLKISLKKTQSLAAIARPAHLPPLVKKDDTKLALKLAGSSVVYGKRIRLKEDTDKKTKVRKEVSKEEEDFVEEVDSPDEDETEKKKVEVVRTTHLKQDIDVDSRHAKNADGENEIKDRKEVKESSVIKEKADAKRGKSHKALSNSNVDETKTDDEGKSVKEARVFGPMRPPENYVIPENYFDQETDRDLPEIMDEE